MNLFECIGGGSSELQETVLWSNSSPTSSFANQVVTLSDDINNYDYIKFYFRVSTSNSASQNVMAPVSDFKNLTDASTSNSFVSLSSPNEYTGSYRMVRRLNYVSATSVRINTSVKTNGQGSDDTLIIPTAIYGLKNVSGAKAEHHISQFTQSISLSDTDYHLIGTGYFLSAQLTRGGVNTTPVVTFYVKNGETYTPVSNTVSTVQNSTNYFTMITFQYGEIYVKRNSGTGFTPSTFTVYYEIK